MGKYYKGMTLKEHLEVADNLAIAVHYLAKVCTKCYKHYPKSDRLIKLLWRLNPNTIDGLFTNLCNYIEEAYWKDTTEEERPKQPFIHYELDKRFKKLVENGQKLL